MYAWTGICDLVFVQASGFANGLGLDIHIRNKGRYQYAYVEEVAIRIGRDILEVGSWGQYWFNGVEGADMSVSSMGNQFPVTHIVQDKKRQYFVIALDKSMQEVIKVSAFKDMVSVAVANATSANFATSEGMMGRFPDGALVGRDGNTTYAMDSDLNAFGQEWQVLPSEPQLFQTSSPRMGGPCVPPSVTEASQRRLAETISMDAAEVACARYKGASKDRCVFDVIAMGDLEVAEATGAF